MKKEKPKIQVIRMMTKGDVEALGGNLWMTRHQGKLIFMFILTMVWAVVWVSTLQGELDSRVDFPIAITPLILAYLYWFTAYLKTGKKLWKEIKDKEQPVDLG
ncbi:hypothetical protein LCGC14_2543320 [marine sediment metagenome]|uniref:Uncharacterized protein n=1 Tax=marine sediment metagenome TaxID=412755 RepID=A0A0F9AQ31_9ZZZZ